MLYFELSINTTKVTSDAEFARALLGRDDLQGALYERYADDGLARTVRARHCQLQISTHQ